MSSLLVVVVTRTFLLAFAGEIERVPAGCGREEAFHFLRTRELQCRMIRFLTPLVNTVDSAV